MMYNQLSSIVVVRLCGETPPYCPLYDLLHITAVELPLVSFGVGMYLASQHDVVFC